MGLLPRPSIAAVVTCVALLAAAGAVEAQRFFREGSFAPRWAPPQMPDASFVVCRLAYRQVRQEQSGIGWQTDYPYAEVNLTTRLSELTKARVSLDDSRQPNFYVVRFTDDALFNCPIVVASDAGTIGIDEHEGARLRTYLLKGGFLWVDDFWGSQAWAQWESEIGRVLPPAEYPIVDLPLDHPLFRSQFVITEFPQIPSIQSWRRIVGTSERGADSEVPAHRAILDRHGNVMVFMTHNTDISDAWEREGEDPRYFYSFSPIGYQVAMNVLLYAMTH